MENLIIFSLILYFIRIFFFEKVFYKNIKIQKIHICMSMGTQYYIDIVQTWENESSRENITIHMSSKLGKMIFHGSFFLSLSFSGNST